MQKEINDGIIIACDFCGTDWDQIKPMVEGHRGSVICLACVRSALTALAGNPDECVCTLCLGTHPAGTPTWRQLAAAEGANGDAVACDACIRQAAEAFGKDRSVDFSYEANDGV